MLPEPWQIVQQLLLLGSNAEPDNLVALDSVLQVIQQSLPTTCVSLLLLEPDHYRYAPIATSVEDWNQQTIAIPYDRDMGLIERDMGLIERIQTPFYDAAIIFTAPGQSPYSLAYYCYLAGIPLRLGQSQEFGGGVLSHTVQPLVETVTLTDYYLYLLKSIGFSLPASAKLAIA